MTVLQIIPRLDAGGAERATIDVAAALVATGHRALVMSAGGAMVEALRRSGAEHFKADVGSKNPLNMWRNRHRLAEFIKSQDVDIVHARSRVPAWSAYFATRARRVPFVTTFHDAYKAGNPGKRLYTGVMARGDRVIAISRFIAEHVGTQYPAARARIAVIPRGIDFSVFDPATVSTERKERFRAAHAIAPTASLIILPARLSHTKGHELTLRALSRLARQHDRCLFIGPGRSGYRERLLALSRSLGLDDRVALIEQTDLVAAYASADLVLSPSQKPEGFGRVAVEAQAMGVPVIATALGATGETVLNGETGWLVPPGDAQALADTIERVLSLAHEQRRALADKAMRHVRARFDVKDMCAATLDVYADLLNSTTAAGAGAPNASAATLPGYRRQ
jgi:glycosyltransferase involved in cell wall biosynthesis